MRFWSSSFCVHGRQGKGTDFSEADEQNIFSHSDQESLNCPLEFGLPDPHLEEKQDHWWGLSPISSISASSGLHPFKAGHPHSHCHCSLGRKGDQPWGSTPRSHPDQYLSWERSALPRHMAVLMPHQSGIFKGWGTTGSSPGKIGGLFISQVSEFPAPNTSTQQQRTCALLEWEHLRLVLRWPRGWGRRWAAQRKFLPPWWLRIWELVLPRLPELGQLVRRDSRSILGMNSKGFSSWDLWLFYYPWDKYYRLPQAPRAAHQGFA